MYMEKNMYNKLILKKQLYSLWLYEGEDIVSHIQWFDQINMDLPNLRVKMENKDKSLLYYACYRFL